MKRIDNGWLDDAVNVPGAATGGGDESVAAVILCTLMLLECR